MYPGGHVVLVDYDDYCRTDRFGKFPAAYPFLGANPATGAPKDWYRDQLNLDFEVVDIRDLKYGREFDVVMSVGLLEHFPDQYKPLALDLQSCFLVDWCRRENQPSRQRNRKEIEDTRRT
jgi:hypothetical protein